jgi:hypothetical protein
LMPHKPKFPEACRHLDLGAVSRTLAKHRLDICGAAKELGVNRTDLRNLTHHNPKLLDEAKEAIELYAARCNGLMIDELHSPQGWRRRRAVEQILASHGHPLAPAPRLKVKSNQPPSEFIMEKNRQWALKKAERDRIKARAIARQEPAGDAFSERVFSTATG